MLRPVEQLGDQKLIELRGNKCGEGHHKVTYSMPSITFESNDIDMLTC